MDKGSLMIIGAHCGDGEIQAGAIASKYARNGHKVTFLHLTAGEKGNPPNMTTEQYRNNTINNMNNYIISKSANKMYFIG